MGLRRPERLWRAPRRHAIGHDRAGDDGNEPAPIAVLHQRVKGFDLSERARERGEQHAFHAVFQGNQVLTGSFPDTLDAVVRAMGWAGHPPLPENQLMAQPLPTSGPPADSGAGGSVGFGEDGDLVHVLTLAVELVDEDALIVMLDELDTVPGAPVDCDCRLRIRGSSFANTRHESTETPFYSRPDASDFGARSGPRGRRFRTSELRMAS